MSSHSFSRPLSNLILKSRWTTDEEGWVVQTVTGDSSQPDSILTRNLVLSAGLTCVDLLNPLLPAHERLTPHYTKGRYNTT